MVESCLWRMKTCLQVEDDFAVLDGDHSSCGEALSVTQSIDLVQDGHRRVAGPEEIRMQGVHITSHLVDGPRGSNQCLTGNLAAEHALAILVGTTTSEDVDFDLFHVQECDEVGERLL
jgi:hypothetical protein